MPFSKFPKDPDILGKTQSKVNRHPSNPKPPPIVPLRLLGQKPTFLHLLPFPRRASRDSTHRNLVSLYILIPLISIMQSMIHGIENLLILLGNLILKRILDL